MLILSLGAIETTFPNYGTVCIIDTLVVSYYDEGGIFALMDSADPNVASGAPNMFTGYINVCSGLPDLWYDANLFIVCLIGLPWW